MPDADVITVPEMQVAGWFRGALAPSPRVRIDVFCDPFDGASGDAVTIRQPRPRELVMIVADACGHGRDAADVLRAATKKAQSLHLASEFEFGSPARVIARLSQAFADQPFTRRGKFVTLMAVHLDVETGDVRLALAGHPPPLIVRGGRVLERNWPAGLPLGLVETSAATDIAFRLEPGDALIAYTDGLPDARKPDGTSIGWDHARDLLCAAVDDPLPVAAIEQSLDAINPTGWRVDDTTAAFLRFG